ncbi:MAG: 1,4-alpha-glucan branching protein GlgB [Sandaracinaceae bacterium]|nr:1,4-alpha-glucan branching protein GlgB [Sandaracinaceae bacterium]
MGRRKDKESFAPILGDVDLHLISEGRHERLYDKLGAHVQTIDGKAGVSFAVWAPSAAAVHVVGDFNGWNGRANPLTARAESGVWEGFVAGASEGQKYKYELQTRDGRTLVKCDPCAARAELPPATASMIDVAHHQFCDSAWMRERDETNPQRKPVSIYEVHLGSWMRVAEDHHRSLTYREIAPKLAEYAKRLGFTHVELLPVMEHPFGGSWGYQVTGYFAATSRFGSPDDLRYLIDHLHQNGVGVILDWVPAHFPKDDFALARFDGTALYEHLDPRTGEHPDWGTYIFNYGRHEVRNFLIASALYWLDSFHVDGLRVDAVASMLYLDYSRKEGEWVPNSAGGRENFAATQFLRELNATVYKHHPGIMMIAEESTAWPQVSRPTDVGGLGFGFKWNMGWMHDTLKYFSTDPLYRRHHHSHLTFGLLYAFTEHFVLPLSHDEVVHLKGSMLAKMAGDRWQKFANLRALYGYMWAHPGRKLLFMGSEFAQEREWAHDQSLDWHLCNEAPHRGMQTLVSDLNRFYRENEALWASDDEGSSFRWLDVDSADANVIAFLRVAPASGRMLLCVCNFAGHPHHHYRIGLPREGTYREIINTDAAPYGGSNVGNQGGVIAQHIPHASEPFSAEFTLPPLGVIWFEVPTPG